MTYVRALLLLIAVSVATLTIVPSLQGQSTAPAAPDGSDTVGMGAQLI